MEAEIEDKFSNKIIRKKVRYHSSKNTKSLRILMNSKKNKNKKIQKNIKKEFKMHFIDNENYRILRQVKNIFDSMDEEEIIDHLNEAFMIFEIDSNFIFIFDLLILFSSLFSFLYVPISGAKSNCFCIIENNYIKILQLIIEILNFLDIVVTFFREYYDNEFKLNKNNMKIAINYLKSQFKFDLLESLPFNFINTFLCWEYEKYKPDGSYCVYNGINGKFIFLKLMKCLKIMKIKKTMSKKKQYGRL